MFKFFSSLSAMTGEKYSAPKVSLKGETSRMKSLKFPYVFKNMDVHPDFVFALHHTAKFKSSSTLF
jgi:hypothetical protein